MLFMDRRLIAGKVILCDVLGLCMLASLYMPSRPSGVSVSKMESPNKDNGSHGIEVSGLLSCG